MPNVKTASDLRFQHESAHPSSCFFTRANMRFTGDTMRNYGIRQPAEITTHSGEKLLAYELVRRAPVKHGLSASAWFDAKTFRIVYPAR